MPRLFVRKSKSIGNWDSINDQTPEDLNFPADVLADVLDAGNEVSVWEIDPESSELEYLVAALHRPADENLSEITFRVVSVFVLDELGLRFKSAGGGSFDSKLNGRHRTIEINTTSDAIKLAKAFKKRPPRILSRAEAMRCFAVSLQEKRIRTDRVAPKLWNRLIEDGFIQVVAQQPRSANAATTAAPAPPETQPAEPVTKSEN